MLRKKVYDDSELNSFIRSELTDDAETKNIYVKRYCKEINWIIQQLNEKKQQNEPVHSMRFREVHVAEKNNHIMISYNRNSRDLCLKIKTELENAGHSVWIDIESIHGSSLESMANAIEESKCVLICMTENYKQSVNCRAEAEYAFTIGRPIVPLILEADYRPDGWLGIILGAKIFVNFLKYSFEESTRRLLAEVSSLCASNSQATSKVTPIVSNYGKQTVTPLNTVPKIPSTTEWSKEEVQNWLNAKEIHADIKLVLKDFDGEMLEMFNGVRTSASDYFFKTLSKNNSTNLFSIIYFTKELKKLF